MILRNTQDGHVCCRSSVSRQWANLTSQAKSRAIEIVSKDPLKVYDGSVLHLVDWRETQLNSRSLQMEAISPMPLLNTIVCSTQPYLFRLGSCGLVMTLSCQREVGVRQ